MPRRISSVNCFAVIVLACSACEKGSESDSNKNSDPTRKDYSGRGTEACQDWQFAYCEYTYSSCDFGLPETMEECLDQYASLVCISDDSAFTCAETLSSASCSDVPEECMYPYIADPAPAVEQCNQYVEAVCTHDFNCDGTPVEECVASYGPEVGCDEVIGTFLVFEECITIIANLGCSELLPEECSTLFLM